MGNTWGQLFRVTTWGESHGAAIGAVVDGCPPRLPLAEADIQPDLDRRRPGQSLLTTQRKESDTVRILSGVFDGVTLGTPIARDCSDSRPPVAASSVHCWVVSSKYSSEAETPVTFNAVVP